MRTIRVLLVMLMSVPLLMMTAGAYLVSGQDLASSYLPDTIVPLSTGTDATGIPSSIGFSIPEFSSPDMSSIGQFTGSSFTMPGTDISSLMGQTGVSSIQGCLDNIDSLTSGIVDVSDFVTLPW